MWKTLASGTIAPGYPDFVKRRRLPGWRGFLFLGLLALIPSPGSAQKSKPMNSIQWSVGGELPPDPAGKPAIGLAGPVTGVDNGVLLVAGGANFPEGMPGMAVKKPTPRMGLYFVEKPPATCPCAPGFSSPKRLLTLPYAVRPKG